MPLVDLFSPGLTDLQSSPQSGQDSFIALIKTLSMFACYNLFLELPTNGTIKIVNLKTFMVLKICVTTGSLIFFVLEIFTERNAIPFHYASFDQKPKL